MRFGLGGENQSLKGGFRFGNQGLTSKSSEQIEAPRKRLGTKVSEIAYTELVRIATRYQFRISQILDEATLNGSIERSAQDLCKMRK